MTDNDDQAPGAAQFPKTGENATFSNEVSEGQTPFVTPKISKTSGRGKKTLRWVLLALIFILVAFVAGWLVSWQLNYRPLAAKWTQAKEDLEAADQRITDLDGQLAVMQGLVDDKQDLQGELDKSQLHVYLLRVLADINAARLALAAEDPASARLYLSLTPERLENLGDLLGDEHQEVIADMQKRMQLIEKGLTRDPSTALADLALLANNLLQIENILFTVNP